MNDTLNVLAHSNAQLGVGEAARRLISLLNYIGLRVNTVPLRASRSLQVDQTTDSANHALVPAASISCVNPDQLGYVLSKFPQLLSSDYKHIGFWAWELEDCPKWFKFAAQNVDEIWTVSDFCTVSFRQLGRSQVRKITLPVPDRESFAPGSWVDLSLGESPFTVLTSFDYLSDINRKNPFGAIEAYKMAFKSSGNTRLIVKSINGSRFSAAQDALKGLADGREDIIFVDDYLSQQDNLKLLALSDVFLSLHRAEGYGINIVDAMSLGTTVISTGYSGNLDFQNEENSILVPYELVPLEMYAENKLISRWAEPDLEFAAAKLKYLEKEPIERKRLGFAGASYVRSNLGILNAATNFAKALNA